jgi:ABC-type lipoprotein release transport system permease subunit
MRFFNWQLVACFKVSMRECDKQYVMAELEDEFLSRESGITVVSFATKHLYQQWDKQ